VNIAAELIEQCTRQGIHLSPNGSKLHVVPVAKLTPELRAALIQHKPEIMRLLPARHHRPVFEFQISDFPGRHILLGIPGETLEQAHSGLHDRYGSRLLDVALYEYPPKPRGGLH